MESIGILNLEDEMTHDNEQLRLLSIVSSVLHLGNVTLQPNNNRDAGSKLSTDREKG